MIVLSILSDRTRHVVRRLSVCKAVFPLQLRVEALAIADYRSPRNATRSRNGNRP